MSKDRDRFEKVIAVALNPGAYEENLLQHCARPESWSGKTLNLPIRLLRQTLLPSRHRLLKHSSLSK